MKPIRVLIFDDNDDRRDSLSMLINATEGLELAGDQRDCLHAIEAVDESRPDVILMDIEMPGINGIVATREIKNKFPKINILIQTVFENTEKIFDSITAGASGYILKSSPSEKIVDAIKDVHMGGSPLSPAIATKMLAYFRSGSASQESRLKEYNLSDRETEVLNQLVKGLSYKLIADKLGISYYTVNTHIRNIYEKLQVHSSGEAVAKAVQQRLVG